MEIQNQAERYIKELHVAQDLRFVNLRDLLDGFDFDEQRFLDQDVEAKLSLSPLLKPPLI